MGMGDLEREQDRVGRNRRRRRLHVLRDPPSRSEAAADRAIDIGARTYGSVKSILDNHLDRRPAQKRVTDGTPILHSNIRGPRYYN